MSWDWIRLWDFTQADWAGLTFLVLVIAAAVALWQVHEARRLREEQAKPFVVVDFEVEQGGAQQIYVVISNIGRTMAEDVRLTFEPEFTSSFDSDENVVSPRELKPMREGIPSLPPQKRISLLVDVFTARDAKIYPDLYRVQVTFKAPALRREERTGFVLDLGVYRNVLHLMRRDVHDVHERLEELVRQVRKWTAPLGGGLLTTNREEEQRRADAMVRRAEREEGSDA